MARTSAGGVQPAEIQDAIYTFAEDAEASDSYAITLTPAPSAYTTGQMFIFKANTANTGAASLNVNSLGAVTIKKRTGTDLANNDIQAGSIVSVVYDGTNFQMISMLANAPAGSGDMVASTYDPAGVSEQLVGLTASQTLTNKTLTTPTLTLKQGLTPTPTAEGDIQWDTDDDTIVVGDGTGQKTFLDGTKVLKVANNLSDLNNAATARSNLGLVIGTNVQAYDAGLASIAGLTTAADKMIYTTASDTYAVADLTSFARTFLDDVDAAAVRTTLGLVIGTNVQAYDAGLASIAGLTTAADRMIYTTASDTYAVATLTSFARQILDDVDAAAVRTTIGALGNLVEDTTPQLGGPLDANGQNITDVHELRLDAVPDTDHTANGLTTNSINAGATIAIGECVYLGAAGTWLLADASATGTADKLLAIALAAGTAANPLLVALPGSVVRDDTWNWTVGGAIYLSETTGALTQTAPTTTDSVVRVLGYALSADVMYFMPETGVVHV